MKSGESACCRVSDGYNEFTSCDSDGNIKRACRKAIKGLKDIEDLGKSLE